jgi:hypothetical protein
MVRRVLVWSAVGLVGAALFYTATSGPRPPSPNAPESLSRPFVQREGRVGDEVQISAQPGAWGERVRGPLHLHFSWLDCDLHGRRCSPVPALSRQSIAPPQELRITTLRGVVTATNRYGSTSVTTSNFFYDEAGYPIRRRKDLRPFLYDPVQFRAWYGLRPEQDGAGQTIVITAFWGTRGLPTAVDRFSSHYGLPRICRGAPAGGNCFDLDDHTQGQLVVLAPVEDEDIEWAHAIAPKARIVVLRSKSLVDLLHLASHVERADDAHVISASWGSRQLPGLEHSLFHSVAATCHGRHVVCTFPAGDSGAPGDAPSSSPYVLAVGGSVFKGRADGSVAGEKPWRFTGHGATNQLQPRPVWQKRLPACRGTKAATTSGVVLHIRSPSCGYRAVPDVTATASGVLEYQIPAKRHREPGWFFGGGTSLSSPLWAGLIALTDQELDQDGQPPVGIDELHAVLYQRGVATSLDDLGTPGWNTRTGWGSPKAGIVDVLTQAIERYRQQH